MKKIAIIAIAIFVVISSSIYYGFSVTPDVLLDTKDEIILESESENSQNNVLINFSSSTKGTPIECDGDLGCALNDLKDVSESESPEIVLKTFSEITFAAKQTGNKCHVLGHELGIFLYGYTGDLSQALSFTDRTCGGSIYHGIMKEYFKTNLLSDDGIPSYIVASKACDELVDVSYSQIRSECAHGIGHGLVIAYNYDALTAVTRCDAFEDGFAQRSCAEGAFMENTRGYLSAGGGTFDEDDLLFPCNVLDEKYAEACYHYHSIYLLNKVNQSVEDAFGQCEKNPNEMQVRHCYYGIGIMNAFYSNYNFDKILSNCQKGNLNYQTYCFAGAVYNTSDQMGISRSFELCQILPQQFKMDCYENLGKWIHTIYFTNEEIEDYCSQLNNSKYYQACINGNPEEIGLL